ncbi:hypothetical protein Dsin_013064 [Dipteronia sinensis]|uniref:Uncharacterized protein n=1 Tax=Dipteronia sinensis TaxID=43782 RepID=A0AAE0AKH3_9ROSI|nr:hypothetical protein Dsin_013064 [Dipteronia sinensis]
MDNHRHALVFVFMLIFSRGRIDELQKQINDLLSSRKLVKASAISPEKYSSTDSVKQIKFEKSLNSILQQELGRLELDFVQFIHRLDVLDKCLSTYAKCIGYLGKEKGSVGRPSRKRKRIVDAIESIELLRKLHLQREEKMSDLHHMLNRQDAK